MKLVVYVVGLEMAHPLAHDDPAPLSAKGLTSVFCRSLHIKYQ